VIFILGGSGFVGSAFVRQCERMSLDFATINRSNYDAYRGMQCDILINCNGNSVKHFSISDELGDFDASVKSVKKSLLDFRFQKYVFVSSGEVYPDVSTVALTRENQTLQINRQTAYGFHKFLAEQCVRSSAGDWLIFRMGGFVGPGLKKNPIYDILIGDALWVSKTSKLQYLDADTTAEVVMAIVGKGLSNEVFNLSGRGVVCLEKVIEWGNSRVTDDQTTPEVNSEINVEKINQYYELPTSSDVVRLFVEQVLDGAIELSPRVLA